jgi:hypothetical protein
MPPPVVEVVVQAGSNGVFIGPGFGIGA